MRKIPVNEDAFTVVELLIAAAMLSMVVAAAYSLYYAGAVTWERGTSCQENQQNLRQAAQSLDDYLRYASWVWLGEDWLAFWEHDLPQAGNSNEIYLSYWEDGFCGQESTYFVYTRIWVGDGDQILKAREKILNIDSGDFDYINTTPYLLADNVKELEFSYKDKDKRMIEYVLQSRANHENGAETQRIKNIVKLENLQGEYHGR